MNDPIRDLANNEQQVFLELSEARKICGNKATTKEELDRLVDSLSRIYINTTNEKLSSALLAQIQNTESVISYRFGIHKKLRGVTQ